MKLIINCTEAEACMIRDAIQDKFHELKHSPSDRGKQLAANMDKFADLLTEGIRLTDGNDEATLTVKI